MRIKRRVCAKYASYAKAMCSSIEFSADQGCLGKQKIRGAVHHKQHLCTQQYIIIIIWRWLKHINTDDIHSSIPRVLQKLKKKSLLSVQVQLKFAKQNNNGREKNTTQKQGISGLEGDKTSSPSVIGHQFLWQKLSQLTAKNSNSSKRKRTK